MRCHFLGNLYSYVFRHGLSTTSTTLFGCLVGQMMRTRRRRRVNDSNLNIGRSFDLIPCICTRSTNSAQLAVRFDFRKKNCLSGLRKMYAKANYMPICGMQMRYTQKPAMKKFVHLGTFANAPPSTISEGQSRGPGTSTDIRFPPKEKARCWPSEQLQ